MSDATYDITPEELQSAAWRGSLYTLTAAIVTGLVLVLLGEIIAEVIFISLLIYAGVGWSAGAAMKHAFEQADELPARTLAVLFALLGILGTKLFSVLIMALFQVGLPPIEALTTSVMFFGEGQLNWLTWVLAFEDPVSSVMMLASPLIGCVIAWRATTGEGAVIV